MNRLVASSILIAVSFFVSALEAYSNPTSVPTEAEIHFSWKDKDGKSLPDTDSRKSKNDFAAQLLMTEDKDLWNQWAVLPPTVAPKITPISGRLKRNTPVFFVFIYANPKVDEKGYVNITCDLTITKPDGKASHPPKPVGWQGKFGKTSTNLQLGYPQIGYAVENSDPKGKYLVEGLVRDHNRKLEMTLRTSFSVE